MKNHTKKRKKWKIVLSILLLAVLCIGGVELAVCRVVDPALYTQITAPVHRFLADAAEAGRAAVQRITSRLAGIPKHFEDPDEELEAQCAGEPTLESDLTLADAAITQLIPRGDVQVLTGGNADIVYYNQGEAPWADQLFGTDPIYKYGCGPTAMAMVVSSLTDQAINPAEMATWAYNNGYWAPGSGSYLSIVEGTGAAYGLTVEPADDQTAEALRRDLSTGKLILALVTKGHFTNNGHFIILRGVTLSGDILVADPNSTERSLVPWDPQIILDELSLSRGHGAPMWRLSYQSG